MFQSHFAFSSVSFSAAAGGLRCRPRSSPAQPATAPVPPSLAETQEVRLFAQPSVPRNVLARAFHAMLELLASSACKKDGLECRSLPPFTIVTGIQPVVLDILLISKAIFDRVFINLFLTVQISLNLCKTDYKRTTKVLKSEDRIFFCASLKMVRFA